MRSVWLPSGHIPLREPPCPERQVGEGECPALDAASKMFDRSGAVKASVLSAASSSAIVRHGGRSAAALIAHEVEPSTRSARRPGKRAARER